MDTVKNIAVESGIRKFYRACTRLWTRIITIGITEELTDWEKKRTRLLNGICSMAVITLVIYCSMYLDPRHRLTFWESFQGLVAYCIVILLNYKHHYLAACHFFNIYNMLSYSFQAISHGYVDGVEYILVTSSIASMLFFRNTSTIITYFLLNSICFAICKYSFTVVKPFLFMPNGENLYASNHVLLFLITFFIVYYFKSENARQEGLLQTKNENLQEEKEKSDNLLLNILPYETAEELKNTGTAKAKSFDMVTVMFSDFRNFTGIAETMTPERLVAEINHCFSAFDAIISKYNIEKIKTIGDAYMCAGGLPVANQSNPVEITLAAMEMQQFMATHKKQREEKQEPFFEVRIGIHTGPVVAGIVGTKKFAYDIWGDTVNTASRMESCSEAGRVNISGNTYNLIKDHFNCTHRGKIAAKNKGEIDMYFINERIPAVL